MNPLRRSIRYRRWKRSVGNAEYQIRRNFDTLRQAFSQRLPTPVKVLMPITFVISVGFGLLVDAKSFAINSASSLAAFCVAIVLGLPFLNRLDGTSRRTQLREQIEFLRLHIDLKGFVEDLPASVRAIPNPHFNDRTPSDGAPEPTSALIYGVAWYTHGLSSPPSDAFYMEWATRLADFLPTVPQNMLLSDKRIEIMKVLRETKLDEISGTFESIGDLLPPAKNVRVALLLQDVRENVNRLAQMTDKPFAIPLRRLESQLFDVLDSGIASDDDKLRTERLGVLYSIASFTYTYLDNQRFICWVCGEQDRILSEIAELLR